MRRYLVLVRQDQGAGAMGKCWGCVTRTYDVHQPGSAWTWQDTASAEEKGGLYVDEPTPGFTIRKLRN